MVFNASLSVDDLQPITNYTWSFVYDGVDEKMYGVKPVFTFEKSGHYDVTLNVTDGVNYDTDLVIINVTHGDVISASLLYSGGAATLVAALLVGLFFALRKGKSVSSEDPSEDDSEEEFEDTIDEVPPTKVDDDPGNR